MSTILHKMPKLFTPELLAWFLLIYHPESYLASPLESAIDMNALKSANTQWTGTTDHTKEFSMDKAHHQNEGLLRLIEKGKETFHISENIDYYSEKDYRQAEKKFIKRCVIGREC